MGRETNPWATWKGQPTIQPTDAECLESCLQNARDAARLEREAQARYDRSTAGSEECAKAHQEMIRHRCDQPHWRQSAEWYRQRIAAAAAARPKPPPPAAPPWREVKEAERLWPYKQVAEGVAARLAGAPPPAREPGEDDDDERVSAWQDLGAAVQR